MTSTSIAICVLFYEKPEQTIACVESFFQSGSPVVVLDNGSSGRASKMFETWSRNHPQVRLLTSPRNLGVSGGRNLLIRETTEDWLLFVDNDIVMSSSEWLDRLSDHTTKDAEVIIPRLYNHHDGCYSAYRMIKVIDNKAYFIPATTNHVNSFPGGASLINRKLFHRLGCYDDQLFVGAEDVELCLRGILAGEPVRALLISDVELTHNHLTQHATEDDVRAVVDRYSKDVIRKSYNRIKEKHGVTFEDGWENWVDQQVIPFQRPLQKDKSSNDIHQVARFPKIALVADARNWAFGNISRNIEASLSEKYDLRLFFTQDYSGNYDGLLSDIYNHDYDLVHFFWRGTILNLYMHLLRTRDHRNDAIVESFIDTKLSFSVYDHSLLTDGDLKNLQIVYKYLSDGYAVSSERLFRTYSKISDYPDPYRIIEDGVDLSKFWPHNTRRLLENDRPIVLGWAGNSMWGKDIDAVDYKGFNSIIKPAIALLKQEGFNVVSKFADRNVEHISYEEMVHYYNSIDIYICASSMEGTPNPILEAMACGVPVISTDVGIVPQLFGPEQKKFILNVRSVHALMETAKTLINNPEQRIKLSAENIRQINGWTRQIEVQKWEDFFSHTLNQNNNQKRMAKRACLEVPYNYGIEATIDRFLENSLSWRLTRPLRTLRWYTVHLKNQFELKYRAGGKGE